MRSAEHRALRGLVRACAWVWLGLIAAPAYADADARPVVLLCALDDSELLARVAGQARDLAVELRALESSPVSREPAALRVLVAERGARGFLCIDATADGGRSVFVFDASTGEAHTRAVPTSGKDDALAASALRETVAIVVRSELVQLLSAVAPLSPSTETLVPQPLAPAVVDTAASPVLPPEAPPSVGPAARVRLGAAWEAQLLGSEHLANALVARAGLSFGALELGLDGAFGLSSALGNAGARAHVQHHALGLSLRVGTRLGSVWYIAAGAQLGLAAFARTTRLSSSGLSATADATTLCGAFGPGLLLRLRLVRGVGLQLGLLLDVVPSAPRYALQRGGTLQVLAHERVLEPAANLGVFFEL